MGLEPYLLAKQSKKKAWDDMFNLDIAKDLIDNEEFWACADALPEGALLHERKRNYSEEDVREAAEQTQNLVATAVRESEEEAENRRIAARIAHLLKPIEGVEKERADVRHSSPCAKKILVGRAL